MLGNVSFVGLGKKVSNKVVIVVFRRLKSDEDIFIDEFKFRD